jgi:hypothetical protein
MTSVERLNKANIDRRQQQRGGISVDFTTMTDCRPVMTALLNE